jgi:DNA-binding response OmpR family regulator
VLNIQARELSFQSQKISLTSQELKLIKAMIEALDNTLEYWQLLEILDKDVTETNKKSLAVFIYRLNKKLEEVGIKNSPIQSVWKIGYQLNSKISII